jgi:hypothetical protein
MNESEKRALVELTTSLTRTSLHAALAAQLQLIGSLAVSLQRKGTVLWRKRHKRFIGAPLCRFSQDATSNFSPAYGRAGGGSI